MGIQFSDWVENIVGKEKIACYEQFLLFPQCFQKLSVVDLLKWVPLEYRVKVAVIIVMYKHVEVCNFYTSYTYEGHFLSL